jgi:hypothetical protein
MKIEVLNRRTGRTCWVASKVFGKLLHLARSHGWHPQRADPAWPSPSWNTELVLPHVGAYMAGTVSESDAQGLASALSRMIAAEPKDVHPSVYLAAQAVLDVAKAGEFEVQV